MLYSDLLATIEKLIHQFEFIPLERKETLLQLTNFIEHKSQADQNSQLNFICTHNSRRSHLAQLWAQAAAHYYRVLKVYSFSGGTEATAFNPRAVKAMQAAGFQITETTAGVNPVYEVQFAADAKSILTFSKKYDHPLNPEKNFAAVMTCSHADENCPLIPGAEVRIALTYDDPKEFDDTPEEEEKYKERVLQIGTEILYAFSKVKI